MGKWWFGTDNGIIRYNIDQEFINKIPQLPQLKESKLMISLKM